MRKLTVFNSVSLDGYFTDSNNDISWAHGGNDPEFDAFVNGNASSGGTLLFGRITYDMMAGFWPTPQARAAMPTVADGMNAAEKIVFSRTMKDAGWNNTRVVSTDIVDEVRRLKNVQGSGMTIMGSGRIIAQLTQARLIDEYHLVEVPVVLGTGRTMFDGLDGRLPLKLIASRSFPGGRVVSSYSAAESSA